MGAGHSREWPAALVVQIVFSGWRRGGTSDEKNRSKAKALLAAQSGARSLQQAAKETGLP